MMTENYKLYQKIFHMKNAAKTLNSITKLLLKRLESMIIIAQNNMTMFLQGNLYSDNYTYFELVIFRCYGDDCQDTSTINSAVSSAYLHLALVNSFFDFDDYDNSVHTYLDDRFIFDLVPGFEKENIIYVRENEADLEDQIVRYNDDPKVKNFIKIERMDSRLSSEDKKGNLLTVRFVKDPQVDTYERTVYSILQLFGDIGGVNEVLEIAGSLIVGVFAHRLFMYSLISHLYQEKIKDISTHPHEISIAIQPNPENHTEQNNARIYSYIIPDNGSNKSTKSKSPEEERK